MRRDRNALALSYLERVGLKDWAEHRPSEMSGGQKQRVALARCLLREGAVLVLDDPISQVDLETGTVIIDMIKSLIGEKTIIIVSHRISAVSFADQIMALQKGRIIERGTHRELIATNQYYAKTFQLQEIEEGLNAS